MDLQPLFHYQSTTDHHVIREWATFHRGTPQLIDHPEAGSDQVGLRIDFPGKEDEVLLGEGVPARDISWDEFFEEFERQQLSFVFIPLDQLKARQLPEDSYRFIKREQVTQP